MARRRLPARRTPPAIATPMRDRRTRARLARRVALAAALLLGTGARLAAQPPAAGVAGRVLDEAQAPLAGASISVQPLQPPGAVRGVVSDSAGGFRLGGLAPGRYRLRAARPGYRAEQRELTLAAAQTLRLELRLRVAPVEVEGITVQGRGAAQRERIRFETDAGVTARVVSAEEMKLLPGLAEADVLRSVELLPGVISTSDFSSAFNVRGGSADQNLILLDGFPIFNPFHLGGLFSVFNPDALSRAELFSGGFGAEYGGRVSSVLNVESLAGEGRPGLSGAAGVSLLASRLMLRARAAPETRNPLGGRGAEGLISARRSYFDQLLRPLTDFPYYLADVQAHASLGTPGGGRLRLTGYVGTDVLDLSEFTPPGAAPEDTGSILRIRWDWGNAVAGARWEQPLGAWLLDTRFGLSHFGTGLGFTDFGDTRFASRIAQFGGRLDAGRPLGAGGAVKLGLEAARLRYRNEAVAGGTEFIHARDAGVLAGGYAQASWRPGEHWIVEPGLRADVWQARDARRATLSPRLAVKRFLGREHDAALKLALGRYTQFLHSQRDEELPFSIDTWVLADREVPTVVSDQAQLGYERFWGERWSLALEAYARRFRGVTEFNPADDPNFPGDELLAGTGRSLGVDLLLRRPQGRLTGWTTVSLLWARRTFPDPLAVGWDDLPPTRSFPPIFDRRLDVDVVLHYTPARRTEAGLRWNFGSGLPFTRPVGQYVAWQYDISEGRLEPSGFGRDDDEAALFVLPGARNAQRYPAYHRLDLTLRRTYERRWGTLVPYLQVLNAYNRRNVLFYFYRYDRTPPTRSGISMFPVLPAVGLDVTF